MTEVELLEIEIARRRLYEPLRFFNPNGAQERFLAAVAEPESKIILFPAGNWVGKTAAAVAALGACMWPEQAENRIFKTPIFKSWPYPKRARIVSTPKELENIGSVQTEIKKWWPAGRYKADKKGKQYPCEFAAGDWIADVMSYEQSEAEFEGATVGLFIFNEPPPENIFNACAARMKFGGKILMPMTPLTGAAWIYDRLVANDGEQGIRVVYGDTEDNCVVHGINGVIPHEAIQALADSCDPDDREARLHGRFMHLAGQIYKGFSRPVHAFALDVPLVDFLSGKDIYQVVDPAIGKPLAAIWAAVDATGAIQVYDEYPREEFQGMKDSNLTVKDYAEMFKTREEGRAIQTRILDRHFGNARRTLGGMTLRQEFGEFGINFVDSYSIADLSAEVETGILKVKDLIRYNSAQPLDGLNRPRLTIADTCKNTIHSFERWGRDEKTGKPKSEYKDFADCVRYLAMACPEVRNYKKLPRPWLPKTMRRA